MANLSRNPFAAKATQVLKPAAGKDPWQPSDPATLAQTYALIGLTDELRRANQIALARELGDQKALASLAETLDVAAPGPTAQAA